LWIQAFKAKETTKHKTRNQQQTFSMVVARGISMHMHEFIPDLPFLKRDLIELPVRKSHFCTDSEIEIVTEKSLKTGNGSGDVLTPWKVKQTGRPNITGIVQLVASVVVCQLAGFIGSIFTMESIPTWYASLNKPFFNPPNWLFAPVWTMLYTLMGVSLFLVWHKGLSDRRVRLAVSVFIAQLILNALWSNHLLRDEVSHRRTRYNWNTLDRYIDHYNSLP